MRRSIAIMLSFAAASLGLGAFASASAQRLAAHCQRSADGVTCDVRSDQPKLITDVTASANGKSLDRKPLEPFVSSGRASAYYFLVQLDAHPVDSMKAIEQITKGRTELRRSFGVATFTGRLEQLAPIGATERDIAELQKRVKKASPDNGSADLYKTALEAIGKLVSFTQADRRALVIFSDGRVTNRDSRDVDELEKIARENNILIYSIHTTAASNQPAGELESLRNKVNGVLLTTQRCSDKQKCSDIEITSQQVADFVQYLERGGKVTITSPLSSGAEFSLVATNSDGTTARAERVTCCATPPAPAADGLWQWLASNWIIAVGGGALGLGALLLGVGMVMWRQPNRGVESVPGTMRPGAGMTVVAPGDTVILNSEYEQSPQIAGGPVYAWLQFLDAESRRVPISAGSIRIGRSKNNEIILNNKSVHREHAIIKRSPEGRFSVHHIGGENVVVVNGQKALQADLNDNDMIELGEVRMRFFIGG